MTSHQFTTRIMGASLATLTLVFAGSTPAAVGEDSPAEGSPDTSAELTEEGFQTGVHDRWKDSGEEGDTGEHGDGGASNGSERSLWLPDDDSNGTDGTTSDDETATSEPLYSLQSICIDEETSEYNVMCSSLYFLNQPCENQGDYEDIEDTVVRCAPDWSAGEEPIEDEESSEPSPARVAESVFMSMSPRPAKVKFEPDLLGFGYKGRHTNMYVDVDTTSTSEELLERTMEIRATPVSYHWDYGDGTSRTTTDPGGPLPDYDGTGEEINKMDFATETSHVYEETGIYPVTVTTVYIGEFRYGDGGWNSIPGRLRVESSPGQADIWTQNSRWVSGACESQDQWGCNGPIQFDPATDRPPKIYQDQYDENGRWLGPVD